MARLQACAPTHQTTEDMMFEMLKAGPYDFAQPLHIQCPGRKKAWTHPALRCHYPSICQKALSRYARLLEDLVSPTLLAIMSQNSTVGFDVIPIVYSYMGLMVSADSNDDDDAGAGEAATQSSCASPSPSPWTSIKDKFKRRRLA